MSIFSVDSFLPPVLPRESGKKFTEARSQPVQARDLEKEAKVSKALFVCYQGYGRSLSAAKMYANLGVPTRYLDRGIHGLLNLQDYQLGLVAEEMALFPYVVLATNESNLGGKERAIIQRIKTELSKTGRVLYEWPSQGAEIRRVLIESISIPTNNPHRE